MPGKIVLVGGEEFRTGCEEMDRAVMAASGKQPASVLIIPTAAVTGPAKAANDGVTHFAALGGAASQLMVLDAAQANNSEFVAPAAQADVVYFTGGSPDHLLATLRDSALLRILLAGQETGQVLGGSSAGAMAMGSVMRRPSGGGWVDGLGIVRGVAVLPHHEGRDPVATANELRSGAPDGVVYLGIDARTGCLGSPGDWLVVGSGRVTVYQAGEFGQFDAGDRLPTGF